MTLIQPGPELQLKIRTELNEDIHTRDDHLKIIKDWLQKQPHLPKNFDDACLMTFLRGCKFSLEKTKRKLDMYFSMRTAIPEFFNDRNVNNHELVEIMKAINIPPLPGLTKDGRRVILMRAKLTTIMDYNASDAMKLVLMIGDLRLFAEEIGVAGDVYILDATGVNAAHFAKFTPTLIKKFAICVQEAYPVKLKEIHIVNVSPFVETIVNFVKPFIKEKIRNRIFFHSDDTYESLHQRIPKEILPDEYGGTAGAIQSFHDAWFKKLQDYTEWFKKQESIKSDESKRIGKPHNIDDLFGVEGSFRQLNID